MPSLSAIASTFKNVLGVGSSLVKESDPILGTNLDRLGFLAGSVGSFAEDNPVEAAAALVIGAGAVVLLTPEIATASAAIASADILEGVATFLGKEALTVGLNTLGELGVGNSAELAFESLYDAGIRKLESALGVTETVNIPGVTNPNTPALTDEQLAQLVSQTTSQLTGAQPTTPTTPTGTGTTDTGTTTPTGTGTTNTGTYDPREILYALNQGDPALSAQAQIQYEESQGDTDLATQLQNALGQDNIGLIAQIQDTQLQGSQLQNQLEQTNPGLDAQIRSQLSSAGDESSGLTATNPTLTQSGATISGDDSETYNVTGNNLSENIGITNTSPVFINGDADSLSLAAATSSFAITDNGQGTAIDLTGFMPSAEAMITLNGFQNDATGSITLPNQYATASAAVAALQSDGQGGSILPLGNGASLHFVGVASLTPANFMVSRG